MDDLTAERFDPTWWGRRLAEHLGTSERELEVFDDCASATARRRRLLAQAAVHKSPHADHAWSDNHSRTVSVGNPSQQKEGVDHP